MRNALITGSILALMPSFALQGTLNPQPASESERQASAPVHEPWGDGKPDRFVVVPLVDMTKELMPEELPPLLALPPLFTLLPAVSGEDIPPPPELTRVAELGWIFIPTPVFPQGLFVGGERLQGPTPGPTVGPVIDPTITPVPLAVPEPATWAMLILGFFAAGLGLRSRSTDQ